jgi:hypothetical protein
VNLVIYKQSEYDKLNKEIKEENVHVIKKNGDVIKAFNTKVTLDSTTWLSSEQKRIVIPTKSIKEITHESSWNGAKKGMIYAIPIGVVTALITYGNAGVTDEIGMDTTILIGASGVVWGSILGAAIGHTDKYILQPPSDSISVKQHKLNEGE